MPKFVPKASVPSTANNADEPVKVPTLSGLGEGVPEPACVTSPSWLPPEPMSEAAEPASPLEQPKAQRIALTLPLGSLSPQIPTAGKLGDETDFLPAPTPRVVQGPWPARNDAYRAPNSFGARDGLAAAVAAASSARPFGDTEPPVRSYVGQLTGPTRPRVTPAQVALLIAGSVAFTSLLAAAYWGAAEVTSVAQGAVVVAGGTRPVIGQVPGAVLDLVVANGDAVTVGQVLAHIDTTDLVLRVRRAEERVALLRADVERLDAEGTILFNAATSALRQKRALLVQRANLKSVARAERHAQAGRVGLMATQSAASQLDALHARELEVNASEESLVIRQQLVDIDLELNDRKRDFDDKVQARSRELLEAEANLNEAAALVDLATVRAPVAGTVQAVLVSRGQVVQPGASLAQIVPDGAVKSIVVFAPAKEAALLATGATAEVEFGSRPPGSLPVKARVAAVSTNVASNDELQSFQGPTSDPMVRVELELPAASGLNSADTRLRVGERVTARLNTAQRRITVWARALFSKRDAS